jgi:hypothetical protein
MAACIAEVGAIEANKEEILKILCIKILWSMIKVGEKGQVFPNTYVSKHRKI